MLTDGVTRTIGRTRDERAEGQGLAAVEFRRALARCAAGVVVVTIADGPTGLTASSFTSVSLSPPLVSFCVDRGSSSWARLRTAERFAVNVLAEGQDEVAARFAQRGVDRFGGPTGWRRDEHGLPLLDGAAVHLVCRRERVVVLGDHALVVGLLTGAYHHLRCAAPLLYHQGRYGGFQPSSALRGQDDGEGAG